MKFKGFIRLPYMIGFIFAVKCSQYTDDVDYNYSELYSDLLSDYKINDEKYDSFNHDDFSIIDKSINTGKSANSPKQIINSYEIFEKIYLYTKHRIPGYDYDEFEFINDKNIQHCDDKSIWTYCLCQFTCNKPNTVDCYTPCDSGCECKENYVFDDDTQQCIYPKHCHGIDEDNNIVQQKVK